MRKKSLMYDTDEIANLIKSVRKARKITQKELGEITDISHQIISRYEKGIEIPTQERLQKIIEALEIDLDEYEQTSNEIDEMFSKFKEDHFFRRVNYDELLHLVKKNNHLYKIHSNYYKVLIILLVYELSQYHLENAEILIKKISQFSNMDLESKQMYFHYMGLYYSFIKMSSKGFEYFEKAISLYHDEKEIAMIHYHMCFTRDYEVVRKYDFEVLDNAMNIFQKYYSYPRIADCLMNYGDFYDYKGNYIKAIENYKNCLKVIELIHDSKEDVARTIRTMAYVHMKYGKYEEALSELNRAYQLDSKHHRIHLYYIWCYYKLHDIQEANHWIVKANRLNLNREMKMILKLFDMLVLQYEKVPSDSLIQQAVKVYDYFVEKDDLDLMIFYLNIVIDLCKAKEDYQQAFFYQEKKLFLIENR